MAESKEPLLLIHVKGATGQWLLWATSGEAAIADILVREPGSSWQFPKDINGKIKYQEMADEHNLCIMIYPDDTPIMWEQ
jgi:hypothetical protein